MGIESVLRKEARGKKIRSREPKPIATKSLSKMNGDLRDLLYFFKEMRVVPVLFLVAVLFSAAAVFFNFLGLRLFIPLIRGMISGEYASVTDKLGVLRWISARFSFEENAKGHVLLLIGAIVVAVVLKAVCVYFSGLIIGKQIRTADRIIRQRVIERVLGFGKLAYDRFNAAAMTHTMLSASASVTRQLKPLHTMLTQFMLLGMYVCVMFWISWKLTIFTVFVFYAVDLTTRRLIGRIKEFSHAHLQCELQLHEKIHNVVSCIALVKTYAMEKYEASNLAAASDAEIKLQHEADKRQQLVQPIQEFNTIISLLTLALLMIWVDPPKDEHQLSSYFIYFFVARLCLPNMKAITNFKLSFGRVEGHLNKLKDILQNDERRYIVRGGSVPFEALCKGIEFHDLTFSYRVKCPVLKGLTTSFPRNKMTAIVGPTGSGKTTAVSLIARLYEYDSGNLLIDGCDIRKFRLDTLARNIAFVSQEPLLFNGTIRENIVYGLHRAVDEDELQIAIRDAQLARLIESLPEGMDTSVGDRGAQLSGGEKQRVAVARALLKKAPILILDEATSALDVKTERSIQYVIDGIKRERTIIVIAHRLSTILNADKVVVLENGTVIEEGGLPDLIEKKGRFFEYWEAQKYKEKNYLEQAPGLSVFEDRT